MATQDKAVAGIGSQQAATLTFVGGSSDYTVLNDNNGDTSYAEHLFGATGTEESCFNMQDYTDPGTILGVTLTIVADNDFQAVSITPYCRIGGVNYYGSVTPMSGSYVTYTEDTFNGITNKNPATDTAWTLATLNAAEFGFKSIVGILGGKFKATYLKITITYAATWNKSLSDTITIADAISRAIGVSKSSLIAIAASHSKVISAAKSDTISISDSEGFEGGGIGFHSAVAQRRYKASNFDAFTFPNPAGGGFSSANDGYYLIAGFGVVSPAVKEVGLNRADTMTIVDAIANKAIGISKADSIAISDVFSKVSEFYRSKADTITIADTFSKVSEFYLIIADTVTITDSEGKSIEITKADLIAITDAISKEINLTKTDTLAIVDVEVKTIGKNLVDLIIITDGEVPIGVLFVPPGIYTIEVHDTDGSLVAVLEKAYNISLEERINAPWVVSFDTPADDSKLTYLTRAREVWVRDVANNTVIAKTKLLRKEDARD